MKTLTNRKTSIKISQDKTLDTTDLIKYALNFVPKNGFTREDLKIRDRIENYLKEGIKKIELEDSDALKLKSIVADLVSMQ